MEQYLFRMYFIMYIVYYTVLRQLVSFYRLIGVHLWYYNIQTVGETWLNEK